MQGPTRRDFTLRSLIAGVAGAFMGHGKARAAQPEGIKGVAPIPGDRFRRGQPISAESLNSMLDRIEALEAKATEATSSATNPTSPTWDITATPITGFARVPTSGDPAIQLGRGRVRLFKPASGNTFVESGEVIEVFNSFVGEVAAGVIVNFARDDAGRPMLIGGGLGDHSRHSRSMSGP